MFTRKSGETALHLVGLNPTLELFNAELSPEKYRLGPRSQTVKEEGGLCLTLHCHPQNDFCVKMRAVLVFP